MSKDISEELADAIIDGRGIVTYSEKDKCHYFIGSFVNKYGIIIEFQ